MAVTANQVIKQQAADRANYPVAASTMIYEGTMTFVTTSGYADDDTASGANAFAGIAVEQVDNSAGSAGDKVVEVYNKGQFELVGSGFAQTDVGMDIYASDNFTITKTRAAAAPRIGRCVGYVSSTKVIVDIRPGVNPSAAIADADGTYSGNEQTAINAIIDVLEIAGLIVTT